MPRLTKLGRLVQLGTLPETRRFISEAARSGAVRDLARRASRDRVALAREVRSPANVRAFLRDALRHPATHELGSAGLLFMPARYIPLGWAATWGLKRILRRWTGPPAKAVQRRRSGSTPRQGT
jgi:hypothetical protein